MRQVTSGSRPFHDTHANISMIELPDCQLTSQHWQNRWKCVIWCWADASAGAVMLSCTLPSRDSVAGSALALIDIEDIPNLHFKAQAPGEGDKVVRADLHLWFALDLWCVHTKHGWSRNSAQALFLGWFTQSTWQAGLLPAFTRTARVGVSLWPKIKFVRVPGQLDADSLNMGYSQPLCGPVGGNCRTLTVSRA
jgi:hypothetical protein